MKVYVVNCFVEGCEECGNERHIVGVFSDKTKAQEVERQHQDKGRKTHIHYPYVDTTEVELQ